MRRATDEGSWISDEIVESYVGALSAWAGAHSVEVWRDDALVGGLYGVHLGGVFFGESMFHRVTDASKVALVALVDRLTRAGLRPARHPVDDAHISSSSARSRFRGTEYLRRLRTALQKDCGFLD